MIYLNPVLPHRTRVEYKHSPWDHGFSMLQNESPTFLHIVKYLGIFAELSGNIYKQTVLVRTLCQSSLYNIYTTSFHLSIQHHFIYLTALMYLFLNTKQ